MTLAEKAGQMLQLDARGDLDDLVLDSLCGSLLHARLRTTVQRRGGRSRSQGLRGYATGRGCLLRSQ